MFNYREACLFQKCGNRNKVCIISNRVGDDRRIQGGKGSRIQGNLT